MDKRAPARCLCEASSFRLSGLQGPADAARPNHLRIRLHVPARTPRGRRERDKTTNPPCRSSNLPPFPAGSELRTHLNVVLGEVVFEHYVHIYHALPKHSMLSLFSSMPVLPT